jgi:hypothetical protein
MCLPRKSCGPKELKVRVKQIACSRILYRGACNVRCPLERPRLGYAARCVEWLCPSTLRFLNQAAPSLGAQVAFSQAFKLSPGQAQPAPRTT